MPESARPQGAAPPAAAPPAWAVKGALARGRARLRDRVGEGPPGQARRLRASRSPLAGRTTPRPPAEVAVGVSPPTNARSASAGWSTSTTSSSGAPTCSSATPSSRRRSDGGSVTSSSTSSRTRARRSSGCCARGSATGTDLCVVGDPDQAIYGFAGADASYLAGFRRVVPRRAASPTSASCNSAATTGRRRRSSRPQARCSGPPAVDVRRCTRRGPTVPCPRSPSTPPPTTKRSGVARALRGAESAQLPWSRMAVLYRVNAQSALFEEALDACGHPVPRPRRRAVPRPPEVQAALDSLRTTAARSTATTVRRAPHRPRHRRRVARRRAARARRRAGPARPRVPRGRRRRAGSVDGFLEFLQTSLRGDDAGRRRGQRRRAAHVPPRQGARVRHRVRHRARDGVWCRSRTPSRPRRWTRSNGCSTSRSAGPSAGCTSRWARERTVGGRVARRTRSTWMPAGRRRRASTRTRHRTASGPATPATASPTPAIAWRAARAAARAPRTRPTCPSPTTPLYAALVDWRLRQSRAASAPAYVIFPNTTLAAIATARPRTPSALLDVPGVGPVKADRYGEAVLVPRGGPRPLRACQPVAVDCALPRVHDGWMSSLPLFPSDDGWPYPDLGTSAYTASEFGRFEPTTDDDVDLDLLELQRRPTRLRRSHRARVLRGVVALRGRHQRHAALDEGPGRPSSECNHAGGPRGAGRRARQAASAPASRTGRRLPTRRQDLPGVRGARRASAPSRRASSPFITGHSGALAPSGPRMHGRLAHTSSATRTDTGMMKPCSRPMQRISPLTASPMPWRGEPWSSRTR